MSSTNQPAVVEEPAPNAAPAEEWYSRLMAAAFLGFALPEIAGIRHYFSFSSPVYWLSAFGLGLSLYIQGWILHKVTYQLHYRALGAKSSKPGAFAILVACASFSLCVTFLEFAFWYRWFGRPLDWPAIGCVGLFLLLIMLVMTKLYHGTHTQESIMHAELRASRFRAEEAAALSASRAYRQAPESILEALRALRALIGKAPDAALQAAQNLASVHRYILGGSWRDLVPLRDELELLETHARLLEVRFNVPLRLQMKLGRQVPADTLIVPVSLHQVLEHALLFGHLQSSGDTPKVVGIEHLPGYIQLSYACSNSVVSEMERNYLENLDTRVAAVTGKHLRVKKSTGHVSVSVPLYDSGD